MSRKLAGFAAVGLTGVRDDVEGAHDETRAVADDADLAVELDVVEAEVLGLRLQRVGLLADLELLVVRVPHLGGVLVQGDLAVERLELVAGQPRERVDLDEGGVLLDEDLVERLDHRHGLLEDGLGELRLGRDRARLRLVDAGAGVDGDLTDGLGVGLGHLLDLHATLDGRDAQVLPVRAVEQEGEVVLLLRRGRRGDQDAVDREPLDLHAEDVRGVLVGLVSGLGDLDAARLAAATGLDLRLDDGHAADLLGGGLRLVGGLDDDTESRRDAVLGEELLRLVLHQIHGSPVLVKVRRAGAHGAVGADSPSDTSA